MKKRAEPIHRESPNRSTRINCVSLSSAGRTNRPGAHRGNIMEVALSLDADSRAGVLEGAPALLALFDRLEIRATIFLSFGPPLEAPVPRSSRSMARTSGLLGRWIARTRSAITSERLAALLPPLIARARSRGHELGARPANLQRWRDDLEQGPIEQFRENFLAASREFEVSTLQSLHSFSSPDWLASPALFELEDERELLYASDTRGTSPFLPSIDGRNFKTLQLPVTLPTWDEVLGSPGLDDESLLAFYRSSVREGIAQVHRIHAEIEGMSHFPLFERLVTGWKSDGVRFVRLETVARRALSRKDTLRRRDIKRREIPGRDRRVACES